MKRRAMVMARLAPDGVSLIWGEELIVVQLLGSIGRP